MSCSRFGVLVVRRSLWHFGQTACEPTSAGAGGVLGLWTISVVAGFVGGVGGVICTCYVLPQSIFTFTTLISMIPPDLGLLDVGWSKCLCDDAVISRTTETSKFATPSFSPSFLPESPCTY